MKKLNETFSSRYSNSSLKDYIALINPCYAPSQKICFDSGRQVESGINLVGVHYGNPNKAKYKEIGFIGTLSYSNML